MEAPKPGIEFEEREGLMYHKVRYTFELSVPCEITDPDWMTAEQRDEFIRMRIVEELRRTIDNIDKFPIDRKFTSKEEIKEMDERDMRNDARNWRELMAFMARRR